MTRPPPDDTGFTDLDGVRFDRARAAAAALLVAARGVLDEAGGHAEVLDLVSLAYVSLSLTRPEDAAAAWATAAHGLDRVRATLAALTRADVLRHAAELDRAEAHVRRRRRG